MENQEKNKVLLSQLAHQCYYAKANNDVELLQETHRQLQDELSKLSIKEQYSYMCHLQNPNNVNGGKAANEYSYVRDSFMQNLANHYSNNVTFVDVFLGQISEFSTDQLVSLKSALIQTKENNFPANTNLNQSGINTQSKRFDEYVCNIDLLIEKIKDSEDFVDSM